MRFPGSRTLNTSVLKAQNVLYRRLNMSRIPEEEHRLKLVEAMGFDGQWDDHRVFQMDFLRRRGMTETSRFLEIGSGPLTLAIPLMQELAPGHYTGVDVRESVMNLAYMEIARAGVSARNPRLIVAGDFGAAALGDETFDILWSFSVLFHLSDELIEEWFANVKRRLAPTGHYWANFNDGLEDSRWLEFPFLNRKAEFYEDIAQRNGLTMKTLGTIEELGFAGPGEDRKNTMIEIRHA